MSLIEFSTASVVAGSSGSLEFRKDSTSCF